MASGENRLIRRRLAGAWLSTVISISLVLLLVGVAGLLVANARSVSDYFKENMQVSVLMKQEVGDDEAMEYVSDLDAKPFIKSTTFVSREQGAKEMTDLLGEDFLNVFEAAPIPVSVDVTLKADYVSSDSLEVVKNEIMKSPLVDEVVYQQSLVDKLNTNLRKISMVLGVFIVLLLFISFVLINNTVRLNVFSRRFTIHTMRLVGATKSFIRAPFLVQAVFQGLFSALLATLQAPVRDAETGWCSLQLRLQILLLSGEKQPLQHISAASHDRRDAGAIYPRVHRGTNHAAGAFHLAWR